MQGAPLRHIEAVQQTLTEKGEWGAALRRMADSLGSGAIVGLVGPRGTGKTQLALRAMLWAGADAEKRAKEKDAGRGSEDAARAAARYTTAMGLFLSLKQTFSDGAKETERDAIEKWCWLPLLVIDECQERGESAWENRILTHIIDRRYGAMLDTILIANLTPEEFSASMGESVIDRIRETGTLIECNWPSFRTKA